ncbi:MAG: carbon-nitrogen hydrolase family protein, partial [Thermoplasmata archaeon]|nr:carbon-nitrogen hydrolase family protein [Thermoplasmata archaeon]
EGPSVKAISDMARENGRAIIVGMPERDMEKQGILYNSAMIALPDGSTSMTRKTHLVNFGPFEEETYFASGGPVFPIFKTPVGKVAIIICFDIFFPELTKYYALKGADMVVCISASPSATREFFEKMMVARAIENTIFFAYSNLVGTENNMVFWGGGALIGPKGGVLAKGPLFEEDIIEVEVDLSELDIARQFRPTIKGTRGDMLKILSNLYDVEEEPLP